MPAFPSDFLWGVSTAGHQIEGDNTTSDTWFLENVEPTIFREPSGKACNSWELWETDLDIIQDLGLNAYRFSVEWARVEPEEGHISEPALAHYEAMVDGCLARGIAPIITFSHFTAPHWFAQRAGWLDERAAGRFARYCGVVMDRFGDRIAAGVTLNEPNLPRLLSWMDIPAFVHDLERATLESASVQAGVPRYRSGNVMVPEDFAGMQDGMTAAHRAAKEAIKSRRPDLPLGLSIAIVDDIAVPGGESVRDRKRAEVYDHWLRLAADDDFVGVQNYERLYYGAEGAVPSPEPGPINQMGTEVSPASLAGAVRYAHERAGVPVFVTEHGIATADDALRAGFLAPSLQGVCDVMSEGVPVLGYLHWSLIDNFEWVSGYSSQLGLVAFDRTDFTRTPKASASVYAELVRAARS
jgi:beta-glucosidase